MNICNERYVKLANYIKQYGWEPVMNFEQAQEFFKSWGMYPYDEDTDDYNQEVIQQGINRPCYEKLIEEARTKHGEQFVEFCKRVIEAQDDAWSLDVNTWGDLEKYFMLHYMKG